MATDPIQILDALNPAGALGRAAGEAHRATLDRQEAEARAFAEIKRRWANLDAWSAETRAPEIRSLAREWRSFSPGWEAGDKDSAALRAQALNLSTAEGNAQNHGYSSPDVRALSAEERGPRGAPRTPTPVDTAPPPERPAPPDPLLVPKAIGVGGLGLGVVLATVSAKSDAARVGIAAGGLVLTGIAGWLAFRPKGEKQ